MGIESTFACKIQISANAKVIADSVPLVYENLGPEVLYLQLWQKLPLPRSRRWSRAVKSITTAVYSMIAERRLNGTDSEDLLGVLLSAKDEHCEGMSDQYVHDEVITMFVAGQETSAVALSWAVGCWRSILNCRSKLQQRLPRWRTAVTYRMRIIHA